jgi:hypothetical protein
VGQHSPESDKGQGGIKNMSELDKYRWSGHSVLMGRIKHEWQDRDYVLSWFGLRHIQNLKKAYGTVIQQIQKSPTDHKPSNNSKRINACPLAYPFRESPIFSHTSGGRG